MNGEDHTKIQNIIRRLREILDELRELERSSQDTSVKQMAISAALALAWVDLVENFRAKEDNGD
jgi:phosphoglycerate-specific signal transduction histidine kinase